MPSAGEVGPWLFGARIDLLLFAGASVASLAIGGLGRAMGLSTLPEGAWLGLVLAVDVAHVHATWFRTYLDRAELARKPLRYALVPLIAYAVAALAYRQGPLVFWRGLAYLAVFHFVRQAVGWVALYRAKAGPYRWFDRALDDAAVYAATLYPLLVWHVHAAEKGFSWFVGGDFVTLPLASWLPAARLVWAGSLIAFFAREAARWHSTRTVMLGKSLVVACTALTWHVGIVVNDSDFMFTASNVIPHGVPYAWLLFAYTRRRAKEAPAFRFAQVALGGFAAFCAVLVGFAFIEQLAWDRLVEHERPWLFGDASPLPAPWLAWVVPLLALPQATHYLLDGLLWRRADSRELPAQRALLRADRAEPTSELPPLGLEVAAK
ncbi:MAG TPA: hypothetical protein VFQ35_26700 [Polyangiaceae bacterium]|nr:hypothetical protein [Polyangiaceae bacterium]